MSYGGSKQKFSSLTHGNSLWLQNARALRPVKRFGAVIARSAVEFLIADDHSGGFFFAPENVDGFRNSCSRSHRLRTRRVMPGKARVHDTASSALQVFDRRRMATRPVRPPGAVATWQGRGSCASRRKLAHHDFAGASVETWKPATMTGPDPASGPRSRIVRRVGAPVKPRGSSADRRGT
jgi:hypothetical protein